MSKARQLERSSFNHIFASEGERYKEQNDNCSVKLELPTTVTQNALENNLNSINKKHLSNSKHNSQSKQWSKPSTIRILMQATKDYFLYNGCF